MLKIDPKITQLAQKTHRQFPTAEVFLVGGGVRDLLLTRTCKDYDLLVRNVPPKKLEAFLKTQGKTNLVGKAFGVFKLKVQSPKSKVQNKRKGSGLGTVDSGLLIDVALPRTEYSLDRSGAYRDFKVQTDYRLPIADDLSRRDFTVNALAYNLITKKFSDPFDGLKDLDKKIIRAVGSPAERLSEDYSRLLRAVRFACQLNFKIEDKTWAAVKKLAKNINKKINGEFVVPRETAAKELLKAFYSNPTKALELFDEAGLIKQLMPELLKMKGCPQPTNWHTEGDVWQHTVLCLKNLSSAKFQKEFKGQPSINLILGLIFHDLGKPYTIQTPEKDGSDRIRFNDHDNVGAKLAKTICQRLKLSAYKDENIDCDCDKIFWLVSHHMLTVQGKIADMKNTTLEKYFFSAAPGDDLRQLMFLDAISTIPRKGEIYIIHFYELEKRLQKLQKLQKTPRKLLPRVILNGNEIMKMTKTKPGPWIGKIINKLREEQLKGKIKTKNQARKFIRNKEIKK